MDYKFRGKCTQSKKWVTGFYYYCKTDRKHFILSLSTNLIAGKERQEEIIVDPETVGQYTGVKDKNGREIYEGDVVLYLDFGIRYHDEEFINKGVVERSDWGFAFSNRETIKMEDMDLSEIEVIGNIHDNPELLNND